MKKFFKWIGIIVLILAVIIGIFIGYITYKVNGMKQDIDTEIENAELTTTPFSIVFMGLDTSETRGGTTARTDALIVATVSPKTGYVSLLSIPRDTYVYQPMRSVSDKINHAYVYNKEEGTLSSVGNLLDEDFSLYITIDFNGFIEMVDALGGLTVDVPVEINEQNSEDVSGAIHLEPGVQTLNGEEALALVRMRKADSDFKRGERQMLVIEAFMDKLLSVQSVTKYTKLADVASKNIKTNLSLQEVGLLGFNWMRKGINPTFETFQITGSSQYMNGVYYYVPSSSSIQEEKTRIKEELEGSKNSEIMTSGTE